MISKQSQVRLWNLLFISIIIIGIYSLGLLYSQEGSTTLNKTITNEGNAYIKGWQVISKTGNESQLTFWKSSDEKKIELGWIPPNNSCIGWLDMPIYNRNGFAILDDKSKEINLKCETAKCSGQNCYHISLTTAQAININDYIKLGNYSFIITYQNESKVVYDFDWGQTNFTLLKNNQIVADELFVYWNYDAWKMGANDTQAQEGVLNNYTYKIQSTDELIVSYNYYPVTYANYPIIYNSYSNETDSFYQMYNFKDICKNNYSNCRLNQSDDLKTIYIDFVSDKYIDPQIINKDLLDIPLNIKDYNNASFSVSGKKKNCEIKISAEINGEEVNIKKKDFNINYNFLSDKEIYYNFSFIPDKQSNDLINSTNFHPIITLENCNDRDFTFNFGDASNDYLSNGKLQAWDIESSTKIGNNKKIIFTIKPSYNNSQWINNNDTSACEILNELNETIINPNCSYIKDEKNYNIGLSDEVMIDPAVRLYFTETSADIFWYSIANDGALMSKWDLSIIPANSNITNASICLYAVSKVGGSGQIQNFTKKLISNQGWDETTSIAAINGYYGAATNTTKESKIITASAYNCFNITQQLNQSWITGEKNFTIVIENINPTSPATVVFDNVGLNLSNSSTINISFEDRENSRLTGNQPYLDVYWTGSAPPYLEFSGCQSLLNPNTEYRQIQNINASKYTQDCLIVSAQNITIDCQGYSINGYKNFSGVYSNQVNTTIKNCNISMGSGGNANAIGIEFVSGANNGLILNNTISGNSGNGIFLNYGSLNVNNHSLINNTASSITGNGIHIAYSNNNNLTGNIALSMSQIGLWIQSSSNNILINNNLTSYSGSNSHGAMVLSATSNNNNLINNTALSNTTYGIYLTSSSNNNLTSNTGTSNSNVGIYLASSSNNTLTSNTGTSNSSQGISLTSASNNVLTNNLGTNNFTGYGIYLVTSSNNNILTNNTGKSSNGYAGIILTTSSNNNTLINNTGSGNVGAATGQGGIVLWTSSNNTLTSNIGITNSSYGIYLLTSSNNILTSNTGTSNSSYAVYLSNSNNNVLINQNATGYSTGSRGIVFLSSNNTIIQDCINVTGVSGDVLYLTTKSFNNTFINCSYRTTGTNETVLAGGSLIRKWYYQANVTTTTGTAINGANILGYNRTEDLEINLTTESTGFTNITTITEYVNNGTRNYWNNYTINASATNYITQTRSENITILTNQLNDMFLLTASGGVDNPPVSILSQPYNNNVTNQGLKTFECNATDDSNLKNVTLYIWNYTGQQVTTNYTAWTGLSNTTTFTYNFTYNGNFTWNCLVFDNSTTSQSDWDTNRSLNITTISVDTTPPYFTTIAPNQNVSYPNNFNASFTGTDVIGFGYYSINWTTLFQINQSGYLNNTATLGVGNYYINVTINDSVNNINSTIFFINVTQNNTYVLNIAITPSNTVTFPTQTVITGSGCPEPICNLYRDLGILGNPNTITLGVGIYNYSYSTSGSNNYSSGSVSTILNVTQNTSAIVYTYLNNTRANITTNNNSAVWLNGTLFNVTGTINLYMNGTLINTGTNQVGNLTNFNSTGIFNITSIYAGDTNYSRAWETWWVNVTGVSIVSDTIYPTFSNFGFNYTNGSTYLSGRIYTANATIINSNTSAGIEFNGKNYTTTNISSLYLSVLGDLGAGTFNYYWWAYGNGTSHLFNKSNTYSYTILQNSSYNLNITGTTPIVYPFASNFQGINCPTQLECKFYRNDTAGNISNPDTSILPAGSYNYTFNSTGNNNYTYSSASKILVVSQNTSTQTGLIFDKTTPISYPTPVTPTCSIITGQGTPTLKVNGTTITSGSPIILGVGTWTFNCSIADNGNYSQASNSSLFQITQNNTYVINITASPSWNVSNPTATTITGVNCPSQITCNLSRNNTYVVNPDVQTLGVGVYNYTYNTTGNANYSSNTKSYILNVNAVADTTPPVFTNLRNFTHIVNTSFSNSITATDDVAIGYYWLNDTTTFIINSTTGLITNTTNLSETKIYYLNISVNDTSGNIASGRFWINVSKDISLPIITITSPEAKTYYTFYKIDINLITSASKNISSWWYNINGSNITFIPNTILKDLSIGSYSLIVYANDTVNNIGSATRIFTVAYENELNSYLYIYLFLFLVASILLVIGYKMDDATITMLSGMVFSGIGLAVWTVGYPSLTNQMLKMGISSVILGTGLYILIRSGMEFMKDD